MFDAKSRYAAVPDAEIELEIDGVARRVRFKRRRFLPPFEAQTTIAEHRVHEGDRLDNLTSAYLGDPTQFWRVCDANMVSSPEELTETIGRVVKIAIPKL